MASAADRIITKHLVEHTDRVLGVHVQPVVNCALETRLVASFFFFDRPEAVERER